MKDINVIYIEACLNPLKRLKTYETSTKREIVVYLIWRFLEELKDFLPKDLRVSLRTNFLGLQKHPVLPKEIPRWRTCVKEVLTAFPKTSTIMYMKKHKNNEVEFRVKEIFENLKNQFEKIIGKVCFNVNRFRIRSMECLYVISTNFTRFHYSIRR